VQRDEQRVQQPRRLGVAVQREAARGEADAGAEQEARARAAVPALEAREGGERARVEH
jgi:hypothetical protein